MWRILRVGTLPVHLYWRVVEAIVQSAAICCVVAISLLVIFLVDDTSFLVYSKVLPPLVVSICLAARGRFQSSLPNSEINQGLVFSFMVLRIAKQSKAREPPLPLCQERLSSAGGAMRHTSARPTPRQRPRIQTFSPAVIHLPPLTLDSPLGGDTRSTESRRRSAASLKVPELARTASDDTASAVHGVTDIVHPSGDAPRNV